MEEWGLAWRGGEWSGASGGAWSVEMKAWRINEQVEESDWRDGGRVRRVRVE